MATNPAFVGHATYAEAILHPRTVTLKRPVDGGYGFSVMGGEPTFVGGLTPIVISRVRPTGPAKQSGALFPRDQIMSINGQSTVAVLHDVAVAMLKNASSELTLCVQQLPARSNDSVPASTAPGLVHSATISPEAKQDFAAAEIGQQPPKVTPTSATFVPQRIPQILVAQVDFERVELLFAFVGSSADELTLQKGDVVHVHAKGSDGWCLGMHMRTGQRGMFPGNFAVKLRPTAAVIEAIYSELEAVSPDFASRARTVIYDSSPLPHGAVGDEPQYESLSVAGSGFGAGSHAPSARSSQSAYELASTANDAGLLAPPAVGLRGGGAGEAREAADEAPLSPALPTLPSLGPHGFPRTGETAADTAGVKVTIIARVAGTGAGSGSGHTSGVSLGGASLGEGDGRTAMLVGGEVVYESSGHAAPPGSDARVHDLYSRVDKLRRAPASVGDIYASISDAAGSVAPTVPARLYDKSTLVPPTMHLQVDDDDFNRQQSEKIYEELEHIGGRETTDTGEANVRAASRNGVPATIYESVPQATARPNSVAGGLAAASPPKLPERRSVKPSAQPGPMATATAASVLLPVGESTKAVKAAEKAAAKDRKAAEKAAAKARAKEAKEREKLAKQAIKNAAAAAKLREKQQKAEAKLQPAQLPSTAATATAGKK